MEIIPLIPFLGVSVPESLVLYYIALTLSRTKRALYYLLALSFITSLFSYTIRLLPLAFGAHTILELGLIFVLVKYSFHIPWRLALNVTVISGIILGVAESISVPLLTHIFSLTLSQAISDPLLRIVVTLPHLILLFVLTHLTARRGWRLRFLERMMSAGQQSKDNDFTGKAYLFLLFLFQTLLLILLNISFHIYNARVFPSLRIRHRKHWGRW